MKTRLKFLVMLLAMVVGGVNSVIAVGNSDNTTNYLGDYSAQKTLAINKKLHYEFTNYTDKAENYHNWHLVLDGISGISNSFVLRADNWWECGNNNPDAPFEDTNKIISFSSNIDWPNFKNDMDGAKVSMDISFLNGGWQIIIRVTAINNGRVYTEILKLNNNPNTSNQITARLSVNHSHLDITREEITNLEFSWNDFTGESAYLDGSKFEAQNSSTDWTFESGYKNISKGWRSFSIKNLQNGDQVIITYEKTSDPNAEIGTNYDAATFTTTNAKTPTGDYVSSTTVVQSETPYTICQDGTLTLNVHRRTVIKSIEINRSTIDGGPRVVFSNKPSDPVAVGNNITEPTLTVYPAGATAYYSSNNTSVAVVDEESGEVTLVGAGDVTITATAIIGGQTYRDSYSLRVTSASTITTTYDFTGSGSNVTSLNTATITNNEGNQVTVLNFNNQRYGNKDFSHPDNRFYIGSGYSIGAGQWYLRNMGFFNGYSGERDFYIYNVNNGDKISFVTGCTLTPANTSSIASSNTNVPATTTIENNTEYIVTESGTLVLSIGRGCYVASVTIEHEESPSFQWSDANLNPKFDTTGGGKKLRYKITDMNFREPTAVKQPSSATHTVKSLNLDVARMNPNTLGDVLFLNTGTVNIQGTMKTNGQDYRDTYTVEVWADVAEFTDVNNRYEVTGIGKLQEKEVTAVRGLKMNFGNDADATLVLYDTATVNGVPNNVYVAYTINKETGWRHRSAGLQSSIPTHGTFYKFTALTSGTLRFGGVKNGENNTVVLMDASDMDGDPVFYIGARNKGVLGTSNEGVPLTAGHTYYLFGNVPATEDDPGDDELDQGWSAYMLTWFSYDSDFKLVKNINNVETEVSYGAAPRTSNADITSVSDFVIVKGDLNPAVTIVGCSGDISSSNATVSKRDSSSCSILSVSGLSGSGGAVRFRITSSGGSDAYYTLTIPYATHSWDFRTGTNDGENGQSRDSLASEIKKHGESSTLGLSGVTRVYRSSSKNASGVWVHIGDPLLAANGNVEGDNGFFIGKTSGLIFVTGAKSFGALETECTWQKPIYTTNEETGEVTITGYTPTTEDSYSIERGLTEVDDETEYYFGPEVTNKAEYVYMKTGSKIIFPGVRPGQYIKLYTRRLSRSGDHWRAENLVDLEDKPYTASDEIAYFGINEDRNSVNDTPHAWAGDNIKGSAMFKVPTNYDKNNTDISLMPSLTVTNGWVIIYKIELLDEYKTDLYLSVNNQNIDEFYKVEPNSEYASIVVYKKNGAVIPNTAAYTYLYEGTVGKIGATHAHTCDYEVVPDVSVNVTITPGVTTSSGNNYNNVELQFNGGNGLVKIIQREYGDDTGKANRADQHIINKRETYIAVSEVNVQTYPYTWDFTNYNMYKGSSTTATSLGNATGTNYGTWTRPTAGVNTFQVNNSASVNTSMKQENISNDSYEQVTKPLFAQGGQLSAESTAIAELQGLGVSRPYGADGTMYTWKTGDDGFGRYGYSYKTYDTTSSVTIDGSTLSGVGTITIPQVDNGMYIFLQASNNPNFPDDVYTIPDGLTALWGNSDPFGIRNDVYLYKNISNTTKDFTFKIPANTTISRIAVTDKVKKFGSTGYATESRDTIIDHTYQDKLTNHPVKAYYIGTNDGSAYNYNNYPVVEKLGPVTVVPVRTGVVLYEDKVVENEDHGTFDSPLCVPPVNVTETAGDISNRGKNYMAPSVDWTKTRLAKDGIIFDSGVTGETADSAQAVGGGSGGPSCTKFILTNTYYRYITNKGDDPTAHTINTAAFYHLKTVGRTAEQRTLGGNKAYLLIKDVPTALWNLPGAAAREGMIYIDLNELEADGEATLVDEAVVDRSQQESVYYTLSGVRVNGRPTAKGIYISNGKKITVK